MAKQELLRYGEPLLPALRRRQGAMESHLELGVLKVSRTLFGLVR